MKVFINPEKNKWDELLARPMIPTDELEGRVAPILKAIKQEGDLALARFTKQFDQVELADIRVSEVEFLEAEAQISKALKTAIQSAKSNIEAFHQAQLEPVKKIETMPGIHCWRKSVGIPTVGLYIPGGTAPLFSTILMLGIPAKIAGCERLILCSPPNKEGKLHPAILYTAALLGIKEVYKAGGSQAIAAMAYGTETVPKVDKLFGPGNQYVTIAKQLVNKEGIAIDMPAGPSEVLVWADETADASFIAADLLSQAEHGTDSQVVLVANSENIVEAVNEEIQRQLVQLPRREIAEGALVNSSAFVIEEISTALALINTYAPEHLIISVREAEKMAESILNAGSVFIGNFSPESVGDYASGTNHTLPTNGFARAYSGVSVDSFVKKITFQQLTPEGLQHIGASVEQMAEAEELEAHKRAVSIRLDKLGRK